MTMPLWRSLLYVPVNVARFVNRAMTIGADAIQLDLEDGVAASEKDGARLLVQDTAARIAASGADVIVRINRPLGLAVRDIEASICPGVTALSLPKVESADHVRLLSETVAEAELRAGMPLGATRLIVGIESPRAWHDMLAIASADRRVVAMLLGGEDFASAVGMATDPDCLLGPKQAMVIAAAAAGVIPLGLVGSFANYRDTEAFRAMVLRSRAIGFRGSSCIHPDQVPLLNDGFSPTEDELAKARVVVAAFDEAVHSGTGAVGLGGVMLDLPVVERARAVLTLQGRIDERRMRGTAASG